MIRCIVFSPPGVGCNRSNPKRTKRALHSRRGPRRIRRKNGPFRANGSRSFGIHSGLHCHVEEVPATFFPVLPRGLSLSELRGTATGIAPALQRRYEVARQKRNVMDKSHVVGLGRAVARSDAEGGAAGRAGTPCRDFVASRIVSNRNCRRLVQSTGINTKSDWGGRGGIRR